MNRLRATLALIGILVSLASPASTRDVPHCTLGETDARWVAQAVDAWRHAALHITGIGQRTVPANAVIFDSRCVWVGAVDWNASAVEWRAETHDGSIRIEGLDEFEAGVTAFATEVAGKPFFVISTPSVWHQGGVPGGPLGLERLMIAVVLHEASHVSQFDSYMAAVTRLAKRQGLDDDFGDDSIQHRFHTNAEFSESVADETDLLFAAAGARDDAEARRLARQARALITARRARWFVGPDSYLTEAEDLFLTLEGSGQWAGYAWLLDPRGGAATLEAATTGFATRSRWWTQKEGLAIFLAVERIAGPSWRADAFGEGNRTALEHLDAALGSP